MPKPRPKGVGDGEQVNIPAPLMQRLNEGTRRRIDELTDGRVSLHS